MKKEIYLLFVILFFVWRSEAQQDPQFTQYMYSDLLINPGVAGSAGICATGLFRQQWAGFNEVIIDTVTGKEKKFSTSPQEILLTLHAPIKILHGGLGLSIYQDRYGYQNDIAAKLAYSFKFNISGGSLGIGIAGDFLSRTIRDGFNPRNPDDPAIPQSGKSDFFVDLSFGAFYINPDKWYAGVSATHLLTGEGANTHQSTKRHVYLYGGYSFPLPFNPNWTLKPSAMFKTDLTTVQFDLTAVAEWNKIVWGGLSWRIAGLDAVAIIMGAKPFINSSSAIRGLEVGVAYDITTSHLGYNHKRSFGSPEIMIKYCFNIIPTTSSYGYKGTRLLGNKPIEY
ncbi:MAG: PorP/SprF family type IX secretion system membrane protein [Bacteroidales bacterium]|jgi:type IX secretion system PorP/SprF family membrane protein|nr:PorP/SprF family type IX secretion system membrane protein [Bacteroidales bacterium]MDD2687097.1 PorP/SprF family type IX secretion system membrane protein [Bacteroidales bacterium]MDD3331085.1 PorP/SprF family type IX secretion system membrane protein [Bacteroidales bacterium]MDD3691089.1 PorP/SprF family type IX secretion system membrane protein [Bacteroidales bacterium]MDD4044552.1 PorP/SprF family type IX secretion system membrane protein [Bacteroidales bacterium]